MGRSVLDSDLRHPRRDAAHRQGDVVVLPLRQRRAAREHGPGLALESGHGHVKSRRPPAGAGPRQPGADEGGQHLVQRPGAARRRPGPGHRRQPQIRGRDDRLAGPEQGLHLQPLQRDLDRAALDGARALVSEPGAAAGWAGRDHGWLRRKRHPREEQDDRAVHAQPRHERRRPDHDDRHARGGRPADRPGRALSAQLPDAERPHAGRRPRSRRQLVFQPGRRRRRATPSAGRISPTSPRTASGAPRCWSRAPPPDRAR